MGSVLLGVASVSVCGLWSWNLESNMLAALYIIHNYQILLQGLEEKIGFGTSISLDLLLEHSVFCEEKCFEPPFIL